jgi:ABC-type branched-subunit amino acid transport system substrate-binding protein
VSRLEDGGEPLCARRLSESQFVDEWQRQWLLSVRAATTEVLNSGTWLTEAAAAKALAQALERRGIAPDPAAVRAGASLIARGRRPLILSIDLTVGTGRRRR